MHRALGKLGHFKDDGCKSEEMEKTYKRRGVYYKGYFSEIDTDTVHCLSPPRQEHNIININRLGHPGIFSVWELSEQVLKMSVYIFMCS